MIKPVLLYMQKYWLSLTLFLLAAITVSSLIPLVQMQKINVPFSDKTHHFIAYASLMFPTALRRPTFWWLIGLVLVGYSGVIELLQPLVNRSGEWLDLLANACGIVIGTELAVLLRHLYLSEKVRH